MQLVAGLCEAFRATPSEATYFAYEIGLADVPLTEFEPAVVKAIRTCRFMPSVSELRELCGFRYTEAGQRMERDNRRVEEQMRERRIESERQLAIAKAERPTHGHSGRTHASLMAEVEKLIREETKQ